MLLSPSRLENSVVSDLTNSPAAIVDVTKDSDPQLSSGIRFSTIQAFKGLESPIAIVTDLEAMTEDDRKSLLYVGMSRARAHLIMIGGETFDRQRNRPHAT